MNDFFAELAKWGNGIEGDESKELTMQKGTSFMLSFMGQQDKAEQMTEALQFVMNFIEPFQKYISPMGAMGVVADTLGGSIPAVGNLFETVENIIGEGVATIVETFMGLVESIAGDTTLPEGFDMTVPSMTAIENFLGESGMLNSLNSASSSLIRGVLDGVSSFVGENVGSILSYIGISLTILSLAYAWFFGLGAAKIGSLAIGGISALIEAVAMLGSVAGVLGVGQVVGLTAMGFPAVIFTVIFYGMGVTETGTNPAELMLIGSDVAVDLAGFCYGVNLANSEG